MFHPIHSNYSSASIKKFRKYDDAYRIFFQCPNDINARAHIKKYDGCNRRGVFWLNYDYFSVGKKMAQKINKADKVTIQWRRMYKKKWCNKKYVSHYCNKNGQFILFGENGINIMYHLYTYFRHSLPPYTHMLL